MIFKEVEKQDLLKLNDLYTQLCGYPSNYDKLCKVWEEEKNSKNYKVFGVYENNEIVGTATVSKCLDLTGDCKYYFCMENFVVDELKRGKGIGTFLISKVEEYARNEGASYMCFVSSSKRIEAHKFYEKNQYKKDYVKGFKKLFV